MKDEYLTWLFIGVAIIFAIVGIIEKDYLWFIRAGIVLIGGGAYYFLVKRKLIGKKR